MGLLLHLVTLAITLIRDFTLSGSTAITYQPQVILNMLLKSNL